MTRTGRPPKTAPWSPSVDRFIRALEDQDRSIHTTQHYRADIAAFAAWWADSYPGETLTLAAVTDQDVREWKRHLKRTPLDEESGRTRKPASVNATMAALKSFLRWAWNEKLIKAMPETPGREKLGARPVKALSRTQQVQLRHEAARDRNPRNLALVDAFLGTGVRVAEMVSLRRRDVVLSERKGTVFVREGKGCKPRGIPIDPDTRDAFRTLLGLDPGGGPDDPILPSQRGDGKGGKKPLKVGGVQALLARYGQRLGWPEGLHPHMLRHTYAANIRDRQKKKGVLDWTHIRDLLGHSSIKTTLDHYATPSLDELRRTADPDADDD